MKKKPEPTQQSRALAAAMTAKGLKNVDVANHVGVTAGAVSHWVTGGRPVPVEKVSLVAEFVGIKPEVISNRYQAIATQIVPLEDVRKDIPTDLAINRLENGLDAMRLAVGILAGVMVRHRPVEAADAARTIRKQLSGKYLNQGFVKELLEVLDASAKA